VAVVVVVVVVVVGRLLVVRTWLGSPWAANRGPDGLGDGGACVSGWQRATSSDN
jgi:hypothetical protein